MAMGGNTMSGVVLTGHGGLDCLVWRDDLPLPAPEQNEVLVQVLAAGMNNTDINTRLGWYSDDVTGATDENIEVDDKASGGWSGALRFPLIQGGDICGRVVAVGAAVDRGWIGKRITAPLVMPRPTLQNPVGMECIGSERNGGFAQYCCLPASDIKDVSPSPLSDIEIAAIPCAYGTAEALLDRAKVAAGKSVLVTGASGGVGMAAVELATLRGANVTGMTSAAKAAAVRAAGAIATIDRTESPAENSFDSVVDVVGGATWGRLIDALKPAGHYAVAGAIAGPIVEMDLRKIYLKDLTLSGSTFQPPAGFERLVQLINAGRLKPLVSKTYPLQRIHTAQEDFQSKRFAGKLVLIPPQPKAFSNG